MKKTIIIVFAMIILMLFGFSSLAFGEPKLWADSAILIDKQTGQVLYEKEAFKQRHPASLTKIMTGILAIEYGKLNDIVTISKRAANVEIGQTIKLKAGQKLRLEDLIYAALVFSANDAAVAIAEHVGGTEEAFLKMMNQKALALGAVNTHFVNANGYSKPNHRTTAYDLALISKYALANPKFASIVNTKEKVIRKIDDGKIEIVNTNRMLEMYPGCFGLKTGTTSAAGGCLAAAAKRDGQELIAIVLKSGNKRRYQDCINLFDYGFNEITEVNWFSKGDLWEEIYIEGAKPARLKVLVGKDLNFKLSKEELIKVEKRLYLNRKPDLPLNKGDKVGEIKIFLEDKEITSIKLVAGNNLVRRTFWNSLIP